MNKEEKLKSEKKVSEARALLKDTMRELNEDIERTIDAICEDNHLKSNSAEQEGGETGE